MIYTILKNRRESKRLREIDEAKKQWETAKETHKVMKVFEKMPRKLEFIEEHQREMFKNFSFIFEDGVPVIGIDEVNGCKFETGMSKKRNERLKKDLEEGK